MFVLLAVDAPPLVRAVGFKKKDVVLAGTQLVNSDPRADIPSGQNGRPVFSSPSGSAPGYPQSESGGCSTETLSALAPLRRILAFLEEDERVFLSGPSMGRRPRAIDSPAKRGFD